MARSLVEMLQMVDDLRSLAPPPAPRRRSLLIESKLVIGRAHTSTRGASYRTNIRYQPRGAARERKSHRQREQHRRAAQSVRGRKGGYKQSGVGREHGRVAVEMYTETKSVCILV